MEDINNRGTTAIIGKTRIRPRLLMQALAFTGILYFCVGQAPPNPKEVINQSSQTRSRSGIFGSSRSGIFGSSRSGTFDSSLLPPSFENYLLQHASKQLGLPTAMLQITQARSQTWSDNCLELGEPEIFCTKTPVPGWQVEVKSGKQTWVYRTNATGTLIKIDWHRKILRSDQLGLEDSLVSFQPNTNP